MRTSAQTNKTTSTARTEQNSESKNVFLRDCYMNLFLAGAALVAPAPNVSAAHSVRGLRNVDVEMMRPQISSMGCYQTAPHLPQVQALVRAWLTHPLTRCTMPQMLVEKRSLISSSCKCCKWMGCHTSHGQLVKYSPITRTR